MAYPILEGLKALSSVDSESDLTYQTQFSKPVSMQPITL